MMFQPKSTEELCVIAMKNHAKFEEEMTLFGLRKVSIIILKTDANVKEKMTFGSINDMKSLVNFTRALKNYKICTLRDFFGQGI